MLSRVFFFAALIACAIAQVAILRVVFARGVESNVPGTKVPRSPRGVEIVWAVIPAIALVALFATTWRAIH